ncbi:MULTISPECIES: Maf family protein [Carboxydothermus]|uniref:dTTP/UTP pyrophosphatase n=2 Tax=Carboxydothermus TaxID=129957 RepID=NTPPA_CARHZ|nr:MULTISPECIES: Maf family protein [Carboxydothermus]Q3AF81.1 RecName: Full=dTTP/UTP pyrophosphatase; Short=dTTPase/UTPase; AltName: Full=Nucleoside triphosphate pyrophosphatase; AltName: Full=Nucleotide pyrophosphatase; Short=Nucleotide PPase [Carboxydothermus hydrogenoformans Z-2901]ABB16164.1 maf protein [Carboxydothermus hydrogenoformans Z-2901]NYE57269.1 septum formation protein [Carboxydothermus ferrireducens DSM 11255]
MKIYLASKSPRRQELLKKIYSRFEIIPPEVKEEVYSLNPMELALTLSRQKAENVAAKIKEGVIIAADTVVAVEGKVLGKPRDEEEAYFMLKTLSGREHEVYTGVTLMELPQKREKSFVEVTKVWFYPLTDEEIKSYIDSREPFDKAGAYGIQGKGALFVAKIEGCYFNVVGLPVARLYRELREWGY